MTIRPFGIARFWHFVVWQTILQCTFTKLGKISLSWQDDIGSDAVKLGRAAGDSIKLLDRQFELAIVIGTTSKQRGEAADRQNCLNGAFAECVLVANDHGAAVILEGGSEDLAGGRALPAGQNNQRTAVSDTGIRIAGDDDVPIGTFGLHDRTRFQK